MTPKKKKKNHSAYQNRKKNLKGKLQVEKCTKISSFFKSDTIILDFNVISESDFENCYNGIKWNKTIVLSVLLMTKPHLLTKYLVKKIYF